MQAGTKVNDMGASRTRKFSEADAVANAEGKMVRPAMARANRSDGVCVAGMHANVQPRNLGGPIFFSYGRWEVRLLHSTRETGYCLWREGSNDQQGL
jgi:hypothetical protein